MLREDSSGKGEIQLVVFSLHGEEFGVDIKQVKEVLKLTQITNLPHTAEYIQGVINLRGDVIPVINLRKRFGILDDEEDKTSSRIIIVEIEGELIGLIVDSVSEVLRLPMESVEFPSSPVAGSKSEFLEGVGKYQDRLLIILKLIKILSTQDRINIAELQDL